jgi:hypothetical protein
MKNLIALIVVCGFAFAFVACGGKKEAATEETTTAPADTTMTAPADTTKTDTTASK